jgi:nucleoside phosphorylase
MHVQPPKRQPTPGLRAIIVTALAIEFQSVCEHLEHTSEVQHKEGSIYRRGLFTTQDGCWEVLVVDAGMNNAGAAVETERALSKFEPRVALLVGVAGGLKDVVPGDVVAASAIYNYESGKEAEGFLARPKGAESSYPLKQRACAEARTSDWLRRIRRERTGRSPQARVGVIVSGEKVLTNIDGPTYHSIRNQYNDALAVEMEASGFMKAVQSNINVHAIVIRGISDLIDGKSRMDAQGWQDVASRHASAFAFELLAKLGDTYSTSNSTDPTEKKGYTHSRQEPRANRRPNVVLPRNFIIAVLAAGTGYWALDKFSQRSPGYTRPSISHQIASASPQPIPPSTAESPKANHARPSLMGPVRTVTELRALTAASLSSATAEGTALQQIPVGHAVFIQPWNISPRARTSPRRASQNVFEVHRLETGRFVLVGGVSQRTASELKAGTRILTLQPDTSIGSEKIIGIPFEMIRSTQVQRTDHDSQVLQVELAAP